MLDLERGQTAQNRRSSHHCATRGEICVVFSSTLSTNAMLLAGVKFVPGCMLVPPPGHHCHGSLVLLCCLSFDKVGWARHLTPIITGPDVVVVI